MLILDPTLDAILDASTPFESAIEVIKLKLEAAVERLTLTLDALMEALAAIVQAVEIFILLLEAIDEACDPVA